MTYEVEQKFRVGDPAAIESKLSRLGAVSEPKLEQADTYLAHPSRDFAKTHEALRVRREDGGSYITYKGPRLEGPTKTRPEIEIPLAGDSDAGAQLLAIFAALGFKQVATVGKQRTPFSLDWHGRKLACVIDRVESLGWFVEIESLASGSEDLLKAQDAVVSLAKELGLTGLEPRSYLRMVMELSGEQVGRNLPVQT